MVITIVQKTFKLRLVDTRFLSLVYVEGNFWLSKLLSETSQTCSCI